MTTWEAVLLGVVQGLFMFVPVSSTSHLALTQHWLLGSGSSIPPPDSAEMILFDIVVHVGTLVSIAVVMWPALSALVAGIVADVRTAIRRQRLSHLPHLRLAGLGTVTVAVTGVLGLLVRAFGTGAFATPWVIAVALLCTGAILWWTDTAGPQWRSAGQITVMVAVAIGVAQAAALLPGLSRSGLTIAMALAVGMHRKVAAEYSFFVAIPTILAAMSVQTFDVIGSVAVSDLAIPLTAYVVAFVVAAAVGAAALLAVLKLLYAARFRYFAAYVVVLALAILVVQPAGLSPSVPV
jgi:undecaprenyl-diphosphatase